MNKNLLRIGGPTTNQWLIDITWNLWLVASFYPKQKHQVANHWSKSIQISWDLLTSYRTGAPWSTRMKCLCRFAPFAPACVTHLKIGNLHGLNLDKHAKHCPRHFWNAACWFLTRKIMRSQTKREITCFEKDGNLIQKFCGWQSCYHAGILVSISTCICSRGLLKKVGSWSRKADALFLIDRSHGKCQHRQRNVSPTISTITFKPQGVWWFSLQFAGGSSAQVHMFQTKQVGRALKWRGD